MKKYATEKIRNLAIVSHGGAGKTSLMEAMLYCGGATDRLGRVDEGTTIGDYDPEEVKRRISISTSMAPVEWKGCKITVLDTPGYADFLGEVKGALSVVEGALVVVDAVAGAEVETEKVWRYAEDRGVSRIVVVNKMDRENADFDRCLEGMRAMWGTKVVPVQLPIGSQASFSGVVDIIACKAYSFKGKDVSEIPIPVDLAGQMELYRVMLAETAAEADDELMMKYLDGGELSDEEIALGVRKGTAAGTLVPVFVVSSLRNIGCQLLLDAIADYIPSPGDRPAVSGRSLKGTEDSREPNDSERFSAQVFKTMVDPYVGKVTYFRVFSGVLKSDAAVYNSTKDKVERVGQLFLLRGKVQEPVAEVHAGDIAAVAKLQDASTSDTLCDKDKPIILPSIEFPSPLLSLAVEPKAKGDEDKIGTGLIRFTDEDPTFKVSKNPETHELIVSGMGELHLEVIMSRLQKKFGVETLLKDPRIPYRETIRGTAKAQGRHKKQSGGRGQFGDVWIEYEALPTGGGFEFVDKVFGGSIPRNYIPAVEKACHEILHAGPLAGYPVVDIRCTLYDGSYHAVDSSEMAFKVATNLSFKKGFMDAIPVLLEPVMLVEVSIPEAYMGDIIGDLNKKRGRVLGMESSGGSQVVKANVPLAEMAKYAIDLRSITQGRGTFVMTFDHYDEVPVQIAQKVIEEHQKHHAHEE